MACARTPCKRPTARRICRRCTFSRPSRIRSASPCRRRGAPICCAWSKSSISPSSKTMSTAFSTTSRRWRVLAPDRCIVLDSLSKKVAPGVALGFIVSPPRLRENIIASVRSGGWTASGYAFAAAQRLMGDGTAAELVAAQTDRCDPAPADGGRMPVRLRNPDQLQILSSLADAAAALAVADLRRRRRPPRHRVDALDDFRGRRPGMRQMRYGWRWPHPPWISSIRACGRSRES